MLSVISKSPQETSYIGERMAKYLSPGDFISLTGDLGAGKTLFAQGIARGLGIEDHITSPTFTIIHEYNEEDYLYIIWMFIGLMEFKIWKTWVMKNIFMDKVFL